MGKVDLNLLSYQYISKVVLVYVDPEFQHQTQPLDDSLCTSFGYSISLTVAFDVRSSEHDLTGVAVL